ncbi:magnesium-translocating P-type ATPase [Microbacterium sp. TNHR37B]|uniref:magnesium-translocating P-type ATPase n=1 Tax=Microbacterium sp. TNHR37B TaxID=1775956 RepID=UPI0007B24FF6|nr:magnesium-translocating P-type ATPase [Microbacterium sp. TNHR37B]KZE91490.1 Magnesium-transporting ATPase, P-type 1 [Microbacterium sp. TNHR37B]
MRAGTADDVGGGWPASPDAARAAIGAPVTGWSSVEAARMLAETGPNTVDRESHLSRTRLLLRQFASPIEVILVAATVLAGILGDLTDAVIILAILLVAGVLGFVQEWNAGRTMAALLATVEVACTARRDGERVAVPLSAVVPGDLLEVSAGDVIPADGIVLQSNMLTIDESTFTGETFPVARRPAVPSGGDTCDVARVRLGTHVASGTATLLAVRTGPATELAHIAAALVSTSTPTGFEKGLTGFGLMLTRVMLVLVVVVFAVNMLLQRHAVEAALFSLALAVGLTPQLLPAIVAIGLSKGARAMARKRVIVRRLDAIEDIGSMSVLCCDKTGTLTEGEVRLLESLDAAGNEQAEVSRLASLNAGLHTGWLNAIDTAVLDACPLDPTGITGCGEVPYDFHRKRQSVAVRRDDESAITLITKGAFTSVLDVCSHAAHERETVPLSEIRSQLEQRFVERSSAGDRVLGLAVKRWTSREPGDFEEADESEMTFVGMLVFSDPVKVDAADVVAQLHAIGVSIRMVTGDNRLVARHVAEQIGLETSLVYTGVDVDRHGEEALAVAVEGVSVFCEMNPVQKERVIRAYRRAGHVTGYLGDGINDAPPLRASDVGLTVDTAVPVAKQSASIVLLDKNLEVTLEGVTQGRRTFQNTMKYIFVTTSANFGNMLSMAVAAPVLPFLPLLASQILAVNLLSDAPAMTIATDAVDDERVAHPEKWDVRLIRTFMIVFGTLSSVFDLATFALLRTAFHADAPEFRTAWFVGSILTEVGVLLVLRTRLPVHTSRPAGGLVLTSLLVVVVTLWLPYSPAAPALSLVALPGELLTAVGVVVLVYLLANEIAKGIFWRRIERGAAVRRGSRAKRGGP